MAKKMKISVAALLLMCGSLFAFDPIGPPPARTLEWTVRSLSNVTFARVDFAGVSVLEAVHFASRLEVPKKYKVAIRIAENDTLRGKRIQLKATDIKQMELLATIAEQAGMSLLVEPGVVTFVERTEERGRGEEE